MLSRQYESQGERLKAIGVPALVVHGADELAPLKAGSEQLAEILPGAQLEELPAAGHMVPIEQPEVLSARIGAFLEGLDR